MSYLRQYDRPGHPTAIFKIPKFVKVSTKYSLQMKMVALEGFAERVPDTPDVCPRCTLPDTGFIVQCGFKNGIAGAAVFICRACKLPHLPVQMGPTYEHLVRIEAQRKFDAEEARASKAANALVVYAKKGRTRGGIPQHLTKSAQLLFRNPVPDGQGGVREGVALPDAPVVVGVAATLEVILFYKAGDTPVTRSDFMRGDGRIYLADYKWLLPYCEETHVYVFERWELFAHRWITIPHVTSSFEIATGVDTVFLRVWGLSCFSLGRELRRYDEKHGTDLLPSDRLSSYIDQIVDGKFWLVAWTQPGEGPTVASLPRKVHKHRSEIHVEDWFGGHGITYWVEREYDWAPFPPPDSAPMKLDLGTNAVLLRRADIPRVLGFGDALEALERSRRLRQTARYAVSVLGLSAPQLGDVLSPHLTHIPPQPSSVHALEAPSVSQAARKSAAARADEGTSASAQTARPVSGPKPFTSRAKVAPGGYRIIFEGDTEVIDLSDD